MTQIELRDIEKYFGAVHVIRDVNLTIDDNEFVVLLGPSGCGKTTTLRAIAGLETIDEGDILIDGKPVQHLQASDRDIAFVFQFFSLYPHMSVYENIAFPLRATPHEQERGRQRRCARSPRSLQITDLLDKKPSALSGGDMQRVAIGRALVRRPKAMLMDEPIGALDAKLREEMRAEIKRLHLKQGSTTIYVTHDQIEAMSLADRIVIMHEGVLQQVGSPTEVYRSSDQSVRRAVRRQPGDERRRCRGRGRRRRGARHGRGCGRRLRLPGELLSQLDQHKTVNGNLALGIRPEGVLVSRDARRRLPAGRGAHHRAARRLRHRRPQGRLADAAGAHHERLSSRRPATSVFARLDPGQTHFFDTASGNSLGVEQLARIFAAFVRCAEAR